jgi:ribosomal protein L37AE/L43A
MNLLIKSAKIIDSQSRFHQKTQDILIEKGKFSKIATTIKNAKGFKEVKLENLHVSVGWFDTSVSFGEPGFEERETINLKKIKNAQKYQYITVCNLCNRPVHNREDARWRCLICGNRFKDKRTTFKIQKGLIYTWTEQRQETE